MKIQLNKYLKKNTLVGIGPMSINSINASIDLAKKCKSPLMLIPSRRQIDRNEGYVANLNSKKFSSFVKNKKNIILCRDHGGPWQNNFEVENKLNIYNAMQSAKRSFETDIDSDFKILHVDPSIDINNTLNIDTILDRVCELVEHCWSYSKIKKKKILFEIGTEEQNGLLESFESYKYALSKLNRFFKINKIPNPIFFVVQFGTKVMEDKNIGSFNNIKNFKELKKKNREFLKIIKYLRKHSIFTKIHNVDYLSNKHLSFLKMCKVGAINIAPEFGVTETRSFINILKSNNLNELLKDFLNLSYSSKKWEKWVINKRKISKYKCSELSGHYIFSKKEFKKIKNEAQNYLLKKNIDIDKIMYTSVRSSISRYLQKFDLLR